MIKLIYVQFILQTNIWSQTVASPFKLKLQTCDLKKNVFWICSLIWICFLNAGS